MKSSLFEEIVKFNNKKISVIVEMSGNHQGSLSGAKKFINTSIESGADIIKFQVYTPDTITLNSKKKDFLVKSENKWKKYKNLYSLYKEAQFPFKWHKAVFKKANSMTICNCDTTL